MDDVIKATSREINFMPEENKFREFLSSSYVEENYKSNKINIKEFEIELNELKNLDDENKLNITCYYVVNAIINDCSLVKYLDLDHLNVLINFLNHDISTDIILVFAFVFKNITEKKTSMNGLENIAIGNNLFNIIFTKYNNATLRMYESVSVFFKYALLTDNQEIIVNVFATGILSYLINNSPPDQSLETYRLDILTITFKLTTSPEVKNDILTCMFNLLYTSNNEEIACTIVNCLTRLNDFVNEEIIEKNNDIINIVLKLMSSINIRTRMICNEFIIMYLDIFVKKHKIKEILSRYIYLLESVSREAYKEIFDNLKTILSKVPDASSLFFDIMNESGTNLIQNLSVGQTNRRFDALDFVLELSSFTTIKLNSNIISSVISMLEIHDAQIANKVCSLLIVLLDSFCNKEDKNDLYDLFHKIMMVFDLLRDLCEFEPESNIPQVHLLIKLLEELNKKIQFSYNYCIYHQTSNFQVSSVY